jgi:hypothetical protein
MWVDVNGKITDVCDLAAKQVKLWEAGQFVNMQTDFMELCCPQGMTDHQFLIKLRRLQKIRQMLTDREYFIPLLVVDCMRAQFLYTNARMLSELCRRVGRSEGEQVVRLAHEAFVHLYCACMYDPGRMSLYLTFYERNTAQLLKGFERVMIEGEYTSREEIVCCWHHPNNTAKVREIECMYEALLDIVPNSAYKSLFKAYLSAVFYSRSSIPLAPA